MGEWQATSQAKIDAVVAVKRAATGRVEFYTEDGEPLTEDEYRARGGVLPPQEG